MLFYIHDINALASSKWPLKLTISNQYDTCSSRAVVYNANMKLQRVFYHNHDLHAFAIAYCYILVIQIYSLLGFTYHSKPACKDLVTSGLLSFYNNY